jgi:hypothetical protein
MSEVRNEVLIQIEIHHPVEIILLLAYVILVKITSFMGSL